MKTKFTQLVLLRKKEVDEAEIMLQKTPKPLSQNKAKLMHLCENLQHFKSQKVESTKTF